MLLDFRKSRELINFNNIFTFNLDLQGTQVSKEAICHYSKGQQTCLNSRRNSSTERMAYANDFDTSDSNVITLNVADFNLISRAIQGDTH